LATDQRVVALVAEQQVEAVVADEGVIALAAENDVRAVVAEDGVVAALTECDPVPVTRWMTSLLFEPKSTS
jgi:hypothetical protein